MEAVIDVSTATTLDSTALEFRANGGAAYLDDVRIHADGVTQRIGFGRVVGISWSLTEARRHGEGYVRLRRESGAPALRVAMSPRT